MPIVDIYAVLLDDPNDLHIPVGYSPILTDLNMGAGGKYIYFLYKSEPNPAEFITSINFVYGDNQDMDIPAGYIKDPTDLNAGAGGDYIYLCTKRGSDDSPVTDLNVIVSDSSVYPWYMYTQLSANGADPKDFWKVIPLDLNQGSGGKFIYLCYKKVFTQSISDIKFMIGNSTGIQPPAPWYRFPVDLNKGVGGKYIYLCCLRGDDYITDVQIIVSDSSDVLPPSGFQKAVNMETNLPQDLDEGAGGNYIYLCYEKDLSSATTGGLYDLNILLGAPDREAVGTKQVPYTMPKIGDYCPPGGYETFPGSGTCQGIQTQIIYKTIPIAVPMGFFGDPHYMNTDYDKKISFLSQIFPAVSTQAFIRHLRNQTKRWNWSWEIYKRTTGRDAREFIDKEAQTTLKDLRKIKSLHELILAYDSKEMKEVFKNSNALIIDMAFRMRALELDEC